MKKSTVLQKHSWKKETWKQSGQLQRRTDWIRKMQDYCTGAIEELTTPCLAAIGKLELEAKDLKLEGALKDWTDSIKQSCMENEEMALAVRKKGKSLKDCMAMILKKAFGEKTQLDDRITKAADLRPPLYISIPGKAQIKEIVREYYLGEKK